MQINDMTMPKIGGQKPNDAQCSLVVVAWVGFRQRGPFWHLWPHFGGLQSAVVLAIYAYLHIFSASVTI